MTILLYVYNNTIFYQNFNFITALRYSHNKQKHCCTLISKSVMYSRPQLFNTKPVYYFRRKTVVSRNRKLKLFETTNVKNRRLPSTE